MTHAIRLRSAWTATPLPDGRTRLARRFGRPTAPAGETVWLCGDAAPGDGTAAVNGEALGHLAAGRPFAFDVTRLLGVRNEIRLDVTAADPPADVRLEVRS